MPIESSYLARIRKKYNDIGEIWDQADRWHDWSKRQIDQAMTAVLAEFQETATSSDLIVDVGSGGNAYRSSACRCVDVDIAEARLKDCELGVCASAELLPLAANISNLTICVGPVVNYCSLEEALQEFGRIAKPDSWLVLHVELSNSWEFFGKRSYRADAAFVSTFYKGVEQYWVYSDNFVRRSLRSFGFEIVRVHYFHILSSLLFRLTNSANFSARLARADAAFRGLSKIGAIADSAIYVCRRTEHS